MTGASTRAPGVVLRVLGDFTVTVDDRVVTLGGPRQKAVLARILAGADEAVSAEQLVDDVWGERSAESTVASVHAYVSRLRRLLGGAAIPRRGGRYLIDRDVVTVDADLFVDDVSRGRAALARGADSAAAAILGAALARWHGADAFGTMRDAHFLAPLAARWEELRVLAAEALADAHARCGRAGDDVTLLHELAERDPLRESVAVRLVRALYAAGRQADALTAFERCRHALAEQLGVDPTPELRRVHAAVLAQEPLPSAVSSALPTNLPPRNRSFVGRHDLLAQVGGALDDDTNRPRAVALVGLPGVGKTELALELAHRRRRAGRVAWWIAAEDPAGTATGLADLAAALGIAAFERGEDTHAALWDELDRAPGWVLVFDNADDPALLEPFLPAARHGDVVITSRNPAWRRLARPVTVAPLRRAESVHYVVGRTGDAAAAADTLAGQLGDLPLALEQACAYIEQTGMSVADYVDLFRERRDSLLLHDPLDSRPTVATTWGLAFDRLHQRSPRAAGLLEAMAFLAPDAIAVATLRRLGPDGFTDELDLQDAIAELLRLSLVDRDAGVVRVHRLVQDVVRARMPVGMRQRRLVEAAGACTVADTEDVAAHLMSIATHAEALATVADGLVEALAELAHRQAARALYPAAQHVLETALRLQDRTGDPVLHGRLVCQLGEVLDAAGHLAPALELHRRAVRILDSTLDPDDVVLAHAYNRLGHVLNCADDAVAAIEAHERALLALQKAGRDDLVPPVLADLGYTLWAAGRLGPAGEALRAAQVLLEGQGRRDGPAWAHATAGLGIVEQDTGNLEEAVALQRTALEVFAQVCGPDHPDTAQTLDKLGYALRLSRRADEAVEVHLRAVRLLERVLGADDSRVAMTLTNLGLAYADAGRIGEAVEAQARARRIFYAALGPEHASTLLAGRRLAVALAASGNEVRARRLMNEVLEVVERRLEDNPAEWARVAADAARVFGADTV
ncbi:BTAD domain-containing putative transcriptional regulator [Pseudonocardia cypriaca]|uniref:DNA-binding SARP family transcriptional activator n=1 Tax=Pseudonocardia cypriaca TaxID=882449 RepID=A0A543FWF1_9PSEU|nr:BTAD domain-containing putative transcriptional regulator [Pseudonocardia cypriaca]TQM38163.1 DNA-binding SARP family transcriptional activator [Pseudonocardia cypriaca]